MGGRSDGFPFGGSGDAQAFGLTLGDRFRRHADSIARADRSPLCVALMRAAADDIDAGGMICELFNGVGAPPGSVPQLRLLAALHELVLSGRAPELGAFYPSVGGRMSSEAVWPAALRALGEHESWIRTRLRRTVQTNEPGRSAVLYGALLWLTAHYRRPIRLLEIGASAGLNLLVDRYCYIIDGHPLGDPESPLRIYEPWAPAPDIDVLAAAAELRIAERAGCDLAPLDPRNAGDRLTLLSYIWPDELERINRTRAALELAARAPARVSAEPAEAWLPAALRAAHDDELIVVWHSLVRQYVGPSQWDTLEAAFADAAGTRELPVVWLGMEPSCDHVANIEVTLRTGQGEHRRLATCGDHGPPVAWVHTDP